MQQVSVVRAVWLLLLIASSVASDHCMTFGSLIVTDPALPLLDIPFCATFDATLAGKDIYLFSIQLNMEVPTGTPGTCPTKDATPMLVTSESLGIDLSKPTPWLFALLWLSRNSSGFEGVIESFQPNVMLPQPLFYFPNVATQFIFSAAVPVGTSVGFYEDTNCRYEVPGNLPVQLDESRNVQFKSGALNVYLCASIASVVSAALSTTNGLLLRNTLLTVEPYGLDVDSAPRHATVWVNVTHDCNYFGLSSNSTCLKYSMSTIKKPTGFGKLDVQLPRGTYYFCKKCGGIDVAVPAKQTFRVYEYDVQPHSSYEEQKTAMAITMDGASTTFTMQAALFLMPGCSDTPVQEWRRSGSAWSPMSAGLYYACVRNLSASEATVYYANQYLVAALPTVTPNRTLTVRGFPLTFTLDTSAEVSFSATYVVALATDPACTTFYVQTTMYGNGATAAFTIGADASALLYYCVSNPILTNYSDSSENTTLQYVQRGTISVRDMYLTYNALQIGVPVTISVESALNLPANALFVFVPSSQYTCEDVATVSSSAALNSWVTASFQAGHTLTSVTFPAAGTWTMCADLSRNYSSDSSSIAYTELQKVAVYGPVSLWPHGVVTLVSTPLTVTDLQPSQNASVTTSADCSSLKSALANATVDANGVATLNVISPFVATTMYVCAGYSDFTDSVASNVTYRQVASFHSTNPRVLPAVLTRSADVSTAALLQQQQIEALRVLAGGASALVGRHVFLATSSTFACPTLLDIPADALVLTLHLGSDADTPVVSLEVTDNMLDSTYRACVETNGTYVDGGTVVITRTAGVAVSNAISLGGSSGSTGSTTSTPLAAGLLSFLYFPRDYIQLTLTDSFLLVDADVNCSTDISAATVYVNGTVNTTTGVSSAFVAPTPEAASSPSSMQLRVCMAQRRRLLNGTFGFQNGGLVTSHVFTSVSRFAQSNLAGGVTGWPVMPYASLFLVSCDGASCTPSSAAATCAYAPTTYAVRSGHGTGGGTTVPSGTYLLCQRVVSGPTTSVIGSNATLRVVTAYKMTSSANMSHLQAFVDFSASIIGGDARVVNVVVQPLSVSCGVASASMESQTFTLAAGVTSTLSIIDITPYANIHFCAKPSIKESDAFEVMTATLWHFMTPSYLRASTSGSGTVPSNAAALTASVTIVFPVMTGDRAALSRAPDCNSYVDGGAPAFPVHTNSFTFSVPVCGANRYLSEVHLCELINGNGVHRGAMLILRSTNCTADDGSASIAATTVSPATPITDFGVNAKFLGVSGISKNADCSNPVESNVSAVGYAPALSERAAFYVCAYLLEAGTRITFVAAYPTLMVQPYTVSPTAVKSQLSLSIGAFEQTVVTLSQPAPGADTFFSTSSACTTNIGDATGMSTSSAAALFSVAGVCGPVYLCTRGGSSISAATTPYALVQFLSVTPAPVVVSSMAAVRGAAFLASFATSSCTTSLGITTSTDDTLTGLTGTANFTSSYRGAFLSTDACASVLDGTTADTILQLYVTAVPRSLAIGLASIRLCIGTGAGNATAIADVPVAPGAVYPTQLTAGASATVLYMPGYGGRTFQLTSAWDNCSGSSSSGVLPGFKTNSSGFGTLSIAYANGTSLPTGNYSLCALDAFAAPSSIRSLAAQRAVSLAAAAVPLGSLSMSYFDTVAVVPSVAFDVRGTSFVVGVLSKMTLLDNLHTSDVLPGFSTTRDCRALSTAYGNWSATKSARAIIVQATQAYTDASSISGTGGLYLCARAPLNQSLVAVPTVWSSGASSITFASSTIATPVDGWDVCSEYTVNPCRAPTAAAIGSSPNLLTLVHGDCCDSTAEANALAKWSMTGGVCNVSVDASMVHGFARNTVFHLCAWNAEDASVCATLQYVTFNTQCGGSALPRSGLSGGAVAGVVIGCVVGSLLLAGLVVWVMWYARRSHPGHKEEEPTEKKLWSTVLKQGPNGGGAAEGSVEEGFAAKKARMLSQPPVRRIIPPVENSFISHFDELLRADQTSGGGGPGNNSSTNRDSSDVAGAWSSDLPSVNDAFGQPLSTNCMDACEGLKGKYYRLFQGFEFSDSDTISNIPEEDFRNDAELDEEALLELTDMNVMTPEGLQERMQCYSNLSREDVLERMERENPLAMHFYLFYEKQNFERNVVEMREENAFFNLRTLARSHVEMLQTQKAFGAHSSAAAATATAAKGDNATAASDSLDSFAGPFPSMFPENEALTMPPDEECTPSQANAWLYDSRHKLEFPYVTNNLQTLVGYRANDGISYNFVYWAELPLVDLQAFHPLHRWWSPQLPRTGKACEEEVDESFDFMAPESEVPFMKRYFLLFRAEFAEREMIKISEGNAHHAHEHVLIDIMLQLGRRNGTSQLDPVMAAKEKKGGRPSRLKSAFSAPELREDVANPLSRESKAGVGQNANFAGQEENRYPADLDGNTADEGGGAVPKNPPVGGATVVAPRHISSGRDDDSSDSHPFWNGDESSSNDSRVKYKHPMNVPAAAHYPDDDALGRHDTSPGMY